jgi:hypothetical protein
MTRSERGLGRWLLSCSVIFSLSLLLAIAASALYQPPNVAGSSRSVWLERDSLCCLASSGLALLVAWLAGRRVQRPSQFSRLLLHTGIGFGLTVFLCLLWVHFLFLLTLLIAPTHAFAVLRLGLLWRGWRAEVAWRAG